MSRTHPPGPRGHWLSGNLPEFRVGRLEFLVDCARRYGDVVALRFAHRRILLVSHPDLIEDVLVTNNQDYIKHFALRLNPLLLGKGLLTSEGDFWLKQRRLVQPAFVRSRIAAYAPDMVAATLRLAASWRACCPCPCGVRPPRTSDSAGPCAVSMPSSTASFASAVSRVWTRAISSRSS
jgi:cytochrome P450